MLAAIWAAGSISDYKNSSLIRCNEKGITIVHESITINCYDEYQAPPLFAQIFMQKALTACKKCKRQKST